MEAHPKALHPRPIFPEPRSGDHGRRNPVWQMDNRQCHAQAPLFSLKYFAFIYVSVYSDGEIRLTTTDLDVGIRGSVEAQVERTGAATLPARRLLSIVRELPSSEIYF